jgi:hypothetical protein
MSETPKRDPRVDPKPGDVFRKGNRERHIIKSIMAGNGWTAYQTGSDIKRKRGGITVEALDYWHQWAKNAEVIHAAGE